MFGEFLVDAQGEDVVAGIRTPLPLAQMEDVLPEAFAQFIDTCAGSRSTTATCRTSSSRSRRAPLPAADAHGKRTAAAALKAAVDMVDEGLISREEAVARIDPAQLDQLLHPMLDPERAAGGRGEGPERVAGAAVGAIVFDADTAEARGRAARA